MAQRQDHQRQKKQTKDVKKEQDGTAASNCDRQQATRDTNKATCNTERRPPPPPPPTTTTTTTTTTITPQEHYGSSSHMNKHCNSKTPNTPNTTNPDHNKTNRLAAAPRKKKRAHPIVFAMRHTNLSKDLAMGFDARLRSYLSVHPSQVLHGNVAKKSGSSIDPSRLTMSGNRLCLFRWSPRKRVHVSHGLV